MHETEHTYATARLTNTTISNRLNYKIYAQELLLLLLEEVI